MPDQQILDYRRPTTPTRNPSLLVSFLFAAPGICTWCILFFGACPLSEYLPPDLASLLFFTSWFIAIFTAIASLVYFAIHWRDLRAWHAIVCLMLNLIGLLFSALALFLN